ncbi:MAG: Chaperone protein DnaJ [Deltaproteobacteria bacterium]|jgi:curved DNA-binding protein CbpA|nr:Chaperone protein DnaJ [Deltaproteobacteria bacterium]
MEQQTLNPYYELGVEPGVTPQQLKQAYRQSVMRYHPDKASGNGSAKKFRQVTEAYQLLQKMNAFQTSHVGKKTAGRASNLRQKFTSVFNKKKQQQTQPSRPWWEKITVPQENDEKIKVNRQTTYLSLEELINCVELSENQYVRQVALEAIAAKKDNGGVNYLLHLLQNSDPSKQTDVIQALGQCGIKKVNRYLFPFVMNTSIETSAAAIKALERIDATNRSQVIEILLKQTSVWKTAILKPMSKLKNHLSSVTSSKRKLGGMLLRSGSITEQQLEIALLMQQRFPLLLGQILRYLEYVTIPEIQNSIASQKKFS